MFSMRIVGTLVVWLCAIMLVCPVKADPNPLWIVTGASRRSDVLRDHVLTDGVSWDCGRGERQIRLAAILRAA